MKYYLLIISVLLSSQYSYCKDANSKAFMKQGLHFLENNGQVQDEKGRSRADIDFSIKNNEVTIFVSSDRISYQWHMNPEGEKAIIHKMDILLKGANKNAQVIREEQQEFVTRFCKDGKTTTALSYGRVSYKNVYQGIDWVLYLKEGQLEYDFVVHEGASTGDIKLAYEGATKLSLNSDGSITANTPVGEVTQRKPVSYTMAGKEIASAFKLKSNTLSFQVDQYEGTLVIDPILAWATYYGGAAQDRYVSVVSDGQGNIYAGGTTSSATSIATNSTTYQGGTIAQCDAFVSKYDLAGNLLWTTYYGTAGDDFLRSLAVDGTNAVYIAGYHDTSGNNDMFVAKLSTSGNVLNAIAIGGAGSDQATGVHCTGNGDVYVCGQTQSTGLGTSGTYQPNYSGSADDGFLARLDNQLSIVWSTYYGASGMDIISGVSANLAGQVYVTGYTSSNTGIATFGTSQPLYAGITDAFISQFDAATGMLNWGTYLGGNNAEGGLAIGLDGAGSVYISGYSNSATGVSTVGSHQPNNAGSDDAIIAKYNSAGILQWCTYYGSNQVDVGRAISVTAHDVLLSGNTSGNNLLVTNGIQQTYNGGTSDAFVAKFNKNTGVFSWGSYYGGPFDDHSYGMATDIFDDVYIAGFTNSMSNISFNTSVQASLNGTYDGFLAKIEECNLLAQPVAINGDDTVCAGTTQTYGVPPIPFTSLYVWSIPTGWTGNSFNETITVTAGSAGGAISMYAYNGCDTTAVITLNVTVNPLPVPVITQAGNTLNTTPFNSYQWYNGASLITGATGQNYTPTQSGNYHVRVTDSNGCVGISNSIAITVGVHSVNKESSIHLYPNPTNGRFAISGEFHSNDGKAQVEIIDIAGRIVYQQQLVISKNIISAQIDLGTSIAPGVYTLRLSSDVQNAVIPFVKK